MTCIVTELPLVTKVRFRASHTTILDLPQVRAYAAGMSEFAPKAWNQGQWERRIYECSNFIPFTLYGDFPDSVDCRTSQSYIAIAQRQLAEELREHPEIGAAVSIAREQYWALFDRGFALVESHYNKQPQVEEIVAQIGLLFFEVNEVRFNTDTFRHLEQNLTMHDDWHQDLAPGAVPPCLRHPDGPIC